MIVAKKAEVESTAGAASVEALKLYDMKLRTYLSLQ